MGKQFRIKTICSECDIEATWIGIETSRGTEMSCIDHPSSFVCPHWIDHHKVADAAKSSSDGKAQQGPVSAEFSWLAEAGDDAQ